MRALFLFFIIYLFLISRINDVSRLFQYHGAEHKVVYNFESGKDISIKNAQSLSTLHPRCGTSFMFIVLLSAIFVFAVVDTITIYFFGKISWPFSASLSDVQRKNRLYLRAIMVKHGFKPHQSEWWHFTLKNEPYPTTYFDFAVE